MTDEDFLRELHQTFAVEAAEHVQEIICGLLELEGTPPAERQRELVETIFRAAHSLKGAARAVNRTDIEGLCQAMESVFAFWKKQASAVPIETFDVLNKALDAVDRLLAQPTASSGAAERETLARMVRHIASLASSEARAPAPKAVAPASFSPPPVAVPPSAPPEPPATTPAPIERLAVADTVRIPTAKMDALLLQAEELLGVKLGLGHQRQQLGEMRELFDDWRKRWSKVPARSLPATDDFLLWNESFVQTIETRLVALSKSAEQEERIAGARVDDLLAGAKRLVMLPFSTLLDLFPRMVRDLARAEQKEVELKLTGREVEIDKRILEEMKDPLLHLVRNAIDHGLESTAARVAAGKPAKASLTISVAQCEGSKVELLVRDDGAGIDVAKVRASAVANGALSVEDAPRLDDEAALQLIFQSGISTSTIITEISGRGLGMAIVREKIEKAGGVIHLQTQPGVGTTFRILLPVTLATFKGVIVGVGGQSFVIPTANLEEVIRISPDDVRTVENRDTIVRHGQVLALARLSDVLELPPAPALQPGGLTEVIVLTSAEKRVAFTVDAVAGEQEVLVKNLGKPLLRVRNVAGATVLGSGTPVIILNAADLVKSAVRIAGTRRFAQVAPASVAPVARKVLVADDSLTSRMLLKNILESAGYAVTTAVDGLDALTTLRRGDFELCVSDVEMPRLDGFALTASLRAEPKLAGIPVVLVTALASREHQERGMEAGANAYIVKGSFEQSNLLDVVRRLI